MRQRIIRTTRFVLPTAALVGAMTLVAPGAAEGWTLTGWSLDLGQRDFRVYNNFTDTVANSNVTPDPNFPGAVGAVLAIWKGCVEWSSALHGDGNGDPTQPFGLGSGGANFDPSFQGLASGPGIPGDNIVSELPGCSGGTLAFTESLTNGSGWRMLFYSCWTWYGSPTTTWPSGGGRFDLQGVTAHEYGHSTGMGHSNVSGATMFPAASDGKAERSISADDIAGIRANYGVAAASKPRITGIVWNGTSLTIDGTGFSPTGNRVWFTRSGFGNGDPVQVANLSSINGTRIVVTPPATAGSGDVLVRNAGTSNAALSQPWPFDINSPTCPVATRYCTPVPSPLGVPALVNFEGSQLVSDNDFTLICDNTPPGTFGLFFYGVFQASTPAGDGVLCIGSPLQRLPAVQSNFLGRASYWLDLTAPTAPGFTITPGSSWNFSFWFRQVSPAGYNFSDAINVIFCN